MVRKRLDDRVRGLLERSIATGQRSMLVLVGDRGKDQIPNLHQILCKSTMTSKKNGIVGGRPKVLWCYKNELGFSTHRMKRMKKIKRDKARGLLGTSNGDTNNAADNFELFISQTDINWCYYRDSHRVLGTTVGLLVLQDFEALTPNLMARTIETVQGGGLIVFLMRTVSSLKQLYAMSMDVHSRYRTESSAEIVPRFNERFILSLAQCVNCLVCDDELNILPISRKALQSLDAVKMEKSDSGEVIVRESVEDLELRELQESLLDTPHIGVLVDLTKTLDQAKAVLVFLEACSERGSSSTTTSGKMTSALSGALNNTSTTVAMTAARGRGKSAAVGLCLAGAISLGYSTIAVTAPEPENLVAVFDFTIRGLHALKYQEHFDYTITYNNAKGREAIKCVTAITLHRGNRQIIQYIPPNETDKFVTCEIVAIDEAAAIPLPIVKALMMQNGSGNGATGGRNDRLTFLSSTVNGYEGTGRALSLKLIKELRERRGSSSRQVVVDRVDAALSDPNAIERTTTKKGDAKIHEQKWSIAANAASISNDGATKANENFTGPLREIELSTPIRYSTGDVIESWLNKLLCLDCGGSSTAPGHMLRLQSGAPAPATCELYSVDRDALFSFHKLSESFLQKIMSLYTSAHYKNTPNDLQMLSDAPAHHLFVLLSPVAEQQAKKKDKNSPPALPDVLAVVQVALEGKISRKVIDAQLARGHRSAGDLIPWTISQQFGDNKFAQLSGARIVRIAVHPSLHGMGYGSRAMELLYRYYNGELAPLTHNNVSDDEEDENDDKSGTDDSCDSSDNDDGGDDKERTESGILGERLKPRKELPPLLLPLSEAQAPQLDWIGTSFGLTLQLHKFWTKCMMKMLYLRQTKNELTGEHSAIMIRALPNQTHVDHNIWLSSFVADTRRRFVTLLGGPFRDMDIRQALSVLENLNIPRTANSNSYKIDSQNKAGDAMTAEEVEIYMTPHDMRRLELYGRNLCDHHLIADLIPIVARLYFLGRFGQDRMTLSSVQSALLCGIGLQQRSVDSLTVELSLPSNQVLAMFNKAIRKLSIGLNSIVEEKEKKELFLSDDKRRKAEESAERMRDVAEQTLQDDVSEAAIDAMAELRRANDILSLPTEISEDHELMRYVVKGTDGQWNQALQNTNTTAQIKQHSESIGKVKNQENIDLDALGTIQIQSTRVKRKAINEEDISHENKKTNKHKSKHDPRKTHEHKKSNKKYKK